MPSIQQVSLSSPYLINMILDSAVRSRFIAQTLDAPSTIKSNLIADSRMIVNIALLALILISSNMLIACSPLIVAGTVAGAGALVATDRRSTENFFEDEAIEIQATDYIYSHKEYGKKVHISVISFNGTVLLVGETLDKNSKRTIFQKISQINGVKNVIDAIEVRELASATGRSHDTWITSKVKSSIIAQKGLLTRTKVVTSNANVYLMGIVSNTEAKQIVNIVKNVDGAKTVTPLFEPNGGSLETDFAATTYMKPAAATYIKPAVTLQKHDEPDNTTLSNVDSRIEAEDDITVQPYVLQPAIQMNSDEK